jgi:centromere protein J
VQTTFPDRDNLQVFKFDNGQIEKHYSDGKKQIIFPDKTLKFISKEGEEETYFVDGTIQRIDLNGTITLEHENGIKVNLVIFYIRKLDMRMGRNIYSTRMER